MSNAAKKPRPKSEAQRWIEERLAELAAPDCAGNIIYAQERRSLRSLELTMRKAGEWVERQPEVQRG